jgi:hypothetical protein
MNMNKKIEFCSSYPWFEQVSPKPIPASTQLPEWFKSMPSYVTQGGLPTKQVRVWNGIVNSTPKKCVPMLDALTSGYLILLWADIFVDSVNHQTPLITWKTKQRIFEQHGATEVGTPAGFNSQPYKFMNFWRILTPPGYSCLITHPHGYQDSKLRAISAVVDTDRSSSAILPPVWIKNNFVGVIEKGTPIIQVTPFKRENWKAEYTCLKNNEEYDNIEDANFNGTIVNHYIKKVWHKKSYR